MIGGEVKGPGGPGPANVCVSPVAADVRTDVEFFSPDEATTLRA